MTYKKLPTIDYKKLKSFKVRISQIPPFDVAFKEMALTDYEMLVATIYRLNELIEINQEFIDFNTEIWEWVTSDGITIAVLERLTEWLNDGTLEVLINETLFNMKLDKSEFEEYKLVVNQTLQDLKQSIQSIINDEISRIDGELVQKNRKGFFSKIEDVGSVINTTNYNADNYKNLFDQLLINPSDARMTRERLGYDQSDTYPIYDYIYTPTKFHNTILVACSIHGGEHYGTYIMYKVLELLLNDGELPLQFEELRNTRIIVIPCANPWGVNQVGAAGSVRRGNSRSVDINRNWDYNFEQATGGFGLSKGEFAFSEKETRAIRYVMERYPVTSFLDLHSYVYTNQTHHYEFQGNPENEKTTNQLIKWLELTYGVTVKHVTTENASTSNNYANRVRNISSMNIEIMKGRFGSLENDVLKWTELILNYLSLQAHSNSRPNNNKNYALLNELPFTSDGVQANRYTITDEFTSIPKLTKSITPTSDGLFIVNGFLNLEVTGETTVTFAPHIEQKEIYESKSTQTRNRPYVKLSAGTHVFPFQVMFPVKKGFGSVDFNYQIVKEGTGTAVVRRIGATYAFIPVDFGDNIWLPQHTFTADNDIDR